MSIDLKVGDLVYCRQHECIGTIVGFYTDEDGEQFAFVEGESGVCDDFFVDMLIKVSW